MIEHKGIKHNIINDAPFVGAIIIAPTCHKNCPDCINEHLKNNTPIFHNSVKEIIDQVKNNPFDEGIILGGLEWTESPESMKKLVNRALKHNLEIIIYTHMKECNFKKQFPNLVDKNIWIKFGEYKKDYKSNNHFSYGVPLASTNQYIKKMGSDV